MTITLSAKLRDYAQTYREVYGEAEDAADLAPFMLAAFIDSDRPSRPRLMREPNPGRA